MKQYIQLNKEKFFQVPTNKNTYYRCTFTCSMSSISVDRFAIPKAKHSIPCFSNAKANQWPYQHHIEKVLPTRSNAKSTCGFSLKLYTNINQLCWNHSFASTEFPLKTALWEAIVFSIHRWNWTIEKAETPAFQIFHALWNLQLQFFFEKTEFVINPIAPPRKYYL